MPGTPGNSGFAANTCPAFSKDSSFIIEIGHKIVNQVLRTTLAFVMRMLPPMKGISTHETDTWNIAGRRSWISNDTVDGAACQRNQSATSAQKALSNFCEAYWPPLYAFVRHPL
jgi:hypothetical protein